MYSLQTIKYFLKKKDYIGAFLQIKKIIISKFLVEVTCILAGPKLNDNSLFPLPEHYKIASFSSWNDISQKEKSIIENQMQYSWPGLLKLIDQGSELWILYRDNEIAGIVLTTEMDKLNDFSFFTHPDDIYFSRDFIREEFRGKDLHPIMLNEIRRSKGSKSTIFYIYSLDWNIFSIRGINKAGFRLVGHFYGKRKKWFKNRK